MRAALVIATACLALLSPLSALSMPLIPIEIGSKEWLQPRAFNGVTWNDINAVCDSSTGACSGALNGHNLGGWSWAGIDDVHGLYNDFFTDRQTPTGPQ